MAEKYPDILNESIAEIVNWIRYVTRSRNDDIGDSDDTTRNIETNNSRLPAPGASGNVLTSDGTDWQSAARASDFDVGDIKTTARASAPTGWLLCYGQAINRTTYAALFTAISTTYGVGDGTTTFNVPDIRGRVIAGKDDMGGVSANRLTNQSGGLDGDALGATGGSETHTLVTGELALHGHPWEHGAGASGNATGGLMTDTDGTQTSQSAYTGTVSGTDGEQIGGTGGDTAHNNVQPTIILNYLIKT